MVRSRTASMMHLKVMKTLDPWIIEKGKEEIRRPKLVVRNGRRVNTVRN
jgi:hypothetical protein